MINTNAYNYVNVLEKASSAAWIRNSLISNNLANVDTPNYKRKDITFEPYLTSELLKAGAGSGEKSLNNAIGKVNTNRLNGLVYTDHATISTRKDGNNVDVETENANLAENQVKMYTLLDSMTNEFSRIKSVLSAK